MCLTKKGEKAPRRIPVEHALKDYLRALEEQRDHFTTALNQQRQEYLEHLYHQAEQQKRELSIAVDQQVKQQEMMLTQEFNRQRLVLAQRLHHQRGVLDQKAIQLKAEFNHGRMQEELLAKQLELQQARQEAERQFASDMHRFQNINLPGHGHGHGGLEQHPPPAAVGLPPRLVREPAVAAPWPCAGPPMSSRRWSSSYIPPPVTSCEVAAASPHIPHQSCSYTPPAVTGVSVVSHPGAPRPCGYGGA